MDHSRKFIPIIPVLAQTHNPETKYQTEDRKNNDDINFLRKYIISIVVVDISSDKENTELFHQTKREKDLDVGKFLCYPTNLSQNDDWMLETLERLKQKRTIFLSFLFVFEQKRIFLFYNIVREKIKEMK